jgi:hypothetical protein
MTFKLMFYYIEVHFLAHYIQIGGPGSRLAAAPQKKISIISTSK